MIGDMARGIVGSTSDGMEEIRRLNEYYARLDREYFSQLRAKSEKSTTAGKQSTTISEQRSEESQVSSDESTAKERIEG